MSTYLNTLFVTTPGAYLAKDHENIAVRVEHQTRMSVPLHHLGGVICFGTFDAMIRPSAPEFRFTTRSRRPPLDEVNALLSFVYALLRHDCTSALAAVGLDPAVGYLHADRPGRPSLALDLMEEFRPALADRLVLALMNRGQVATRGFVRDPAGGVSMDSDTRKTVLVAYQERKQATLTHPVTNEATTWGLVPHIQARLLARTIRGDLDHYPPFLVR